MPISGLSIDGLKQCPVLAVNNVQLLIQLYPWLYLHLICLTNLGGARSNRIMLWCRPCHLDGVPGLWVPGGCPWYEPEWLDTRPPRTCHSSTCVCRRSSQKFSTISRCHHVCGHPYRNRNQSGHWNLPRYSCQLYQDGIRYISFIANWQILASITSFNA